MIKVLIADDHKMFIDGLKSFLSLEKGIEVVGEALNGEKVIEILEVKKVDVAIIDIEMPELDGIETTKYIKIHYPDTKVLILTMYNEKRFIMKIMEIGASGYILKQKSKESLVGAIHSVHKGNPFFGLEVLNMITSGPSSKKEEEIKLTKKEIQVLCLIAEGMTSKEISNKLSISTTTVNTHKRNLLTKIKVPNDKHLVRFAIKNGYVEL